MMGRASCIPNLCSRQVFIHGVTGEDFTFYDMDFLGDNKHGYLIGSRQTLLETYDAGKTWKPRYLNTGDDLPYRYHSTPCHRCPPPDHPRNPFHHQRAPGPGSASWN